MINGYVYRERHGSTEGRGTVSRDKKVRKEIARLRAHEEPDLALEVSGS